MTPKRSKVTGRFVKRSATRRNPATDSAAKTYERAVLQKNAALRQYQTEYRRWLHEERVWGTSAPQTHAAKRKMERMETTYKSRLHAVNRAAAAAGKPAVSAWLPM